jgi:hypothetical protein
MSDWHCLFRLTRIALVSMAAALAIGGGAAAQTTKTGNEPSWRKPVMFFVAKGAADSCGKGCDTWIAAEGMIDLDAGQRFRSFLSEPKHRELPIFFNSAGGRIGQSLALGRLMREHRMKAGVGRTSPAVCRVKDLRDDDCRSVVASAREHQAKLSFASAHCNSACVYALAGAFVRRIAREAAVGVHPARPVDPADVAPRDINTHNVVRSYLV